MVKPRADSLKFYKTISLLAIVIAIVALAQPYFSKGSGLIPVISIDELSTIGYTKVDVQVSISGNVGVVTIQSGCYQLTATTEASQIESIASGQEKTVGFRPLTHDLFNDALDSLEVDVVMVKIVDMQNNTYIGRLILKQDDRIVSLDSRPSDGIAVAVRANAPIYIKDDLLKAQGKYVC